MANDPSIEHPEPSEQSREPGSVWIVDDSPLEAEMARRAIEARHTVTVFSDGAMMLERLAGGVAPDALVLDWQLPGMSGIDVCRFLRASLTQIELPVLLLTVHGHKQDIVEGLAAGANDYVTKPYDPSELAARVGTLVRTRRLYVRAKRAERALELERDRLSQSERRFRFVARASVALALSLDSKAAATSMVGLAVPEVADWCGIYLREAGGAARPGERPFGPPGPADAWEWAALAVSSPTLSGAPGLLPRVPPTSAVRLVRNVRDALSLAEGEEAAHLVALQEAGVVAWMAVPLANQGQPFGCIAFAMLGSGREFDEADLLLAEEIGRRTAVAIDNARLFEMTQKERARVEEASRAKDEFIAMVSHELRTPLSAILGYAVMLGSNTLAEEKRARAVATIERNARSQAKLIEDLLDVSRIISGKLRLHVSPMKPLVVIEAALETIRPAAEAKDVRIQSLLDTDAGSIHGDAERVQQIVWNLLSNAVKFTPKGGRVQIRLQRLRSDIEIVVSDTGQGISAEFLPHVFERFRQADMGKARSHGGLGLGLAITRHLVELHGGRIEAASPGEGLGTTFTVRIPVAPLSSARVPEPAEAPAPATPAEPIRRDMVCPPGIEGLRVLLVEDEPDARELVVQVLEGCKAKVTTAASVAAGMDALRTELPDILISDVGMPGETGYDLIRKLRSLPPDKGGRTPAVALTAYARMEDRTTALMMGFDMHITKPIEPSELLVVLANLASRHRKP